VTLEAGSSEIEPGITPAKPVTLKWETFTEAANEAGMSRRYGGIHFARADMAGRKLGGLVADRAWAKAQTYFDGTNSWFHRYVKKRGKPFRLPPFSRLVRTAEVG
jgi:hypothetical protein